MTKAMKDQLVKWFGDNNMSFSLILRGSEHGMTAENFHDRCDGKGENVVVVKSSDTDQVFGG